MKRIIALIVSLCMVFVMVGCTQNNKSSASADSGDLDVVSAENSTDTENKTSVKEQEEEKQKLTLYYSDAEAIALHPYVKDVEADAKIDAGYAVTELLKAPGTEELINVIPEGTVLNSWTVDKGLCTVDFSAHLLDAAGSAAELMAIYSIVNTLCALEGVDMVQFTVDGQKVMAFGGYQFDEPFEADMTLVQK